MIEMATGAKDRECPSIVNNEATGGGAQIPAHSGQLSWVGDFPPPSSWPASFMAFMAAQWGAGVSLTKGEAMAALTNSTNHTSTKRVIR